MYGCETWSIAKKEQVMLNTWQRKKLLMKVYRRVTEQGV